MTCSLSMLHFLNSGDEGSLYMALLIVLMGFFEKFLVYGDTFCRCSPIVISHSSNMGKLNCNMYNVFECVGVHSL